MSVDDYLSQINLDKDILIGVLTHHGPVFLQTVNFICLRRSQTVCKDY